MIGDAPDTRRETVIYALDGCVVAFILTLFSIVLTYAIYRLTIALVLMGD